MIAIIDYGAGNLRSIARSIEATGERTLITANPTDLQTASAIVLPGDGHAGYAMRQLDQLGLTPAIHDAVDRGTPFLGVCLGMHLLFGHQEEGDTYGLGLLEGRVRAIRGADKVPHIGWNRSTVAKPLPGLQPGDSHYFYFLHSYVAETADPADIAATCLHGEDFACVVARDNVWGTQFHPEKSSHDGLALVASWIESVRLANAERAVTG
jgi:glutamine amidotransferase